MRDPDPWGGWEDRSQPGPGSQELGEGLGALRPLKTMTGHPGVAERKKATDELSDGKGRRTPPGPVCPQQARAAVVCVSQ